MGLEAATFIHQLNAANPVGAVDPKAQGDDHLRLIKATLQATFPNITGAMTATQAQLNGVATAAAPTVKVKATGAAAAGTAVTFVRTDAQMLLDLTDSYAWTNQHIFNAASSNKFIIRSAGALGNNYFSYQRADTTEKGYVGYGSGGSDDFFIYNKEAAAVVFGTNNITRLTIGTTAAPTITSTLPILEPDGSAAVPSYSFASDPDTGIYRGAANTISIGAGGAVKLAIDTTALTFGANVTIKAQDGAAGAPVYTFEGDPDTGFYRGGSGDVRFASNGTLSLLLNGNGQFQVDGNVSNPSYSFINDSDTGFYRVATGNTAYAADGAQTLSLGAAASGALLVADFGGTLQKCGFRNIPQNIQAANYTCVLADSGKHIYHANGAGAGDTYTIPANATVAYDIGTAITFINQDANAVSIAITTDTMTLAGSALTGTRTLAQNGIATAVKVTATSWLISGTGLT